MVKLVDLNQGMRTRLECLALRNQMETEVGTVMRCFYPCVLMYCQYDINTKLLW